MTTALNLIEGAAKLIGVLNKGENLQPDDAADGLVALNDLLASWSNDSLLVYTRTEESFALVSGQAAYTIGVGQNFNTTRPTKIISAQIRDPGGIDFPVEIISDEDFQAISYKAAATPLPQYLNYTNAHPYSTINLAGTPNATYTLRLLTEKPLLSFATVNTTADLPAGWNKAIKFNLAVDMATEYLGKNEIDPLVILGAKESKGTIKKAVIKNRPLVSVKYSHTKDNVYTGLIR